MEPATILVALKGISSGIEALSALGVAGKKAELNAAKAELTARLLEATQMAAVLQTENLQLRRELDEAKRLRDIDQHLEYRDACFFLPPEHGGKGHGLYCTRCWGESKLLILLSKQGEFTYRCPKCNWEHTDFDRVQKQKKESNCGRPQAGLGDR